MGRKKASLVEGEAFKRRFVTGGKSVPYYTPRRYELFYKTKNDAQNKANSLRNRGYLVRVVKEKRGYRVWYRNKRT